MKALAGHLRVEERKKGRVWVAKYDRASGKATRKTLGPAWVKASGRRTARGAVVWRAADGSKPDGYLTPADAAEALQALLEAEEGRRDQLAAMNDVVRVAPGVAAKPADAKTPMTLQEAGLEWIEYLVTEKGIERTTANGYRVLLRAQLVPRFGATMTLPEFTARHVDDFMKDIARGRWLSVRGREILDERGWGPGRAEELAEEDESVLLSPNRRRQIWLALNGIFKYARRQGWVTQNPLDLADKPKVPTDSGDFHVLTPIQIEAVSRAIAADWQPVQAGPRYRTRITEKDAALRTEKARWAAMHWAAVTRIAAYTGLRAGELRALRWLHIDWGQSVIHVKRNWPASLTNAEFYRSGDKAPKSGKVGALPLIPQAAATLDALSRRTLRSDDEQVEPAFVGPQDFVFPNYYGGMADFDVAREAFYKGLDLVGLGYFREMDPPIKFHDLRHTFGTLAVRRFPLSDVQVWMRHADIKTTMKYIHYVPQHDAAAKLGEVFAAELGPIESRVFDSDGAGLVAA